MLPCAGLVGIVPALGIMTKEQNPAGGPIVFPWWKLMLWSLALAFLGVFIAVPLRTQTVIKVRNPCCTQVLLELCALSLCGLAYRYVRHTSVAGTCVTSSSFSVQEKLRFPSGTATAKVIRMLHGGAALDEADEPHPHAVCTLPVVGEVGWHARLFLHPASRCDVGSATTAAWHIRVRAGVMSCSPA